MRQSTAHQQRIRKQWLRCLHLALAGIFALVLPFICWGAETTPGHPHARAHFVFLTPTHRLDPVQPVAKNAHDLIHQTASELASGVRDLCTMALRSTESASTTPAGQSTPLVLAVTLLLLAVTGVLLALLRRDGAGFLQRTSMLFQYAASLDVTTPPPRISPR